MRWIIIPGWDKFQHYRDRRPVWIKNYLDQHDRDEYLELPAGTRALLHDLRLMYARRRGQIRLDTRWLSGELHVRVTTQQLEALNHAGFISFSASKPVPIRYESGPSLARAREETEAEREKDQDLVSVRDQTAGEPAEQEPANHETSTNGLHVERELHAFRLASILPDKDEGTMTVLRALARELPQAAFETVYEKVRDSAPKSPAAYAVAELKRMKQEGQYA